jgi:hypothetical protein
LVLDSVETITSYLNISKTYRYYLKMTCPEEISETFTVLPSVTVSGTTFSMQQSGADWVAQYQITIAPQPPPPLSAVSDIPIPQPQVNNQTLTP